MRLLSIASGSSGNCIYVGNDTTHILIDTGISGKKVEQGLNSIGLSGKDIDAVFVTHEHVDHIAGLGVFSRKWNTPVYGSKGTIHGSLNYTRLGEVDEEMFQSFNKGEAVTVGSLVIHPIPISHDAQEPTAYRIEDGEKKVAVATDMGFFDESIVKNLQGLDALLIEANHDINMLQVGPYPFYLKQRILGKKGHLSNESCGKLLNQILHDDMKKIYLGHLSKENNLPELAYEAVRLEITMGDAPYHASDFSIEVAKRDEPTDVFEF